MYSLFWNFGGFPNPVVDIFCELYHFPKIYSMLLAVHTKIFNMSIQAGQIQPSSAASAGGVWAAGAGGSGAAAGFFLRWREGFLGGGVPSQPPAAR